MVKSAKNLNVFISSLMLSSHAYSIKMCMSILICLFYFYIYEMLHMLHILIFIYMERCVIDLIVHSFVPQIFIMPDTVLGARNIAGNNIWFLHSRNIYSSDTNRQTD